MLEVLEEALAVGASDLHLDKYEPETHVPKSKNSHHRTASPREPSCGSCIDWWRRQNGKADTWYRLLGDPQAIWNRLSGRAAACMPEDHQ